MRDMLDESRDMLQPLITLNRLTVMCSQAVKFLYFCYPLYKIDSKCTLLKKRKLFGVDGLFLFAFGCCFFLGEGAGKCFHLQVISRYVLWGRWWDDTEENPRSLYHVFTIQHN